MDYNQTIQIFDIEISSNINQLFSGPQIILYGAGEKAREIYGLLKEAGIQDNCFMVCDGNAREWGKLFSGSLVIKDLFYINELVRSTNKELFLIACVENPSEVLDILEKHIQDVNGIIKFITYWGIKRAIYANRKDIIPEESFLYTKWHAENATDKLQRRVSLINEWYLKMSDESDIIGLFLPGKTGTTSIEYSLNHNGIKYYKTHFLKFPEDKLDPELRSSWELEIKKRKKRGIKIITTVREPLSRDYSAFWQPMTYQVDAIRMTEYDNTDFQIIYEKYMEAILKGNDYIRNSVGECFFPNWVDEFEWYNEEFREVLGVDIYDHHFDTDKGYTIIRDNNLEIFLYKCEKFDAIKNSLADFIGIKMIEDKRENVSANKRYGLAYKDFRNKVVLSQEYVDHYYVGNLKFDHFYGDEEKKQYLKEWKPQIR